QHSRVELEERNAPGKRVVQGFEHEQRERLRISNPAAGALAIAGARHGFHRCPGCGSWQKLGYELQQQVHPDIAQTRGEQDWKNAVLADRVTQSRNKVLVGDGALVEELFHKGIVAL